MTYIIENHLRKVIEVQNIVLKYQQCGVTQKWIYENHIKERFHISLSTFYNYLSRNAKQELEKHLRKPKK